MPGIFIGLAAITAHASPPAETVEPTPRLWYTTPTTEYMSGLPIGNGLAGAMVLGEPGHERIGLNHGWLWRGKTRDRTNPNVGGNLPEIRRLFFEGKIVEASNRANAELGTRKETGVDPYQPFGDLLLRLAQVTPYTEYRRELDLSTGIVTTTFRAGGVGYTRQDFLSRRDNVLVTRLTADKPYALTGEIELSRREDPECTLTPFTETDRFGYTGRFTEGLRFAAIAQTHVEGGTWEAAPASRPSGAAIRLHGASSILLVVAMATEHDAEQDASHDPAIVAKTRAAEALQRTHGDFALLRDDHVRLHQSLFNRVHLRLGQEAPSDLSTDRLLETMKSGQSVPALEALYFQYGRYLLLSSSTPGGLPANLQGLWNEDLHPPWDADFHHDINIQMNYWPAEPTNLSVCQDALFDYVERMIPHGREAARSLYGCNGVWFPHATDVWALTNKTQGGWSEWTGAAPWLAQHFWWRYEFTGDRMFLAKRAYPFFKAVADFYSDFLVEDPRPNSRWHGRLVTVPSQSPENRFVGGIDPVSLCIGATMDFELIHDLFTHLLAASEILGADADRRDSWRRILERIPPLQIGKHGQLQEWLEDYDEVEPGHRHFSHLFALFPGDQILLETTPELAAAARTSLERRLSNSGGHTGWSRSWVVGLWARLGEGDKAEEHLRHLITDFATVSLLDLHPPHIFQIDGNFGGTAGITELLLQSQGGIVRLLPALPAAWPDGEVRGLRARGGFEISLTWAKGKATTAILKSERGSVCRLRPPHGQTVESAYLGRRQTAIQHFGERGEIAIDCPPNKPITLHFSD